jgi:exodeoxyribonuclease-3
MVTVASWNVNSVRTRLSILANWLREKQPDIVLLQELKCTNENFPYQEIEECGYSVAVHGQKSYNGVAILSRYLLEDVHTILPNNPDKEQSRYIEGIITLPNKKVIRVASVYVPNGQEIGSDKFEYKLKFLNSLAEHTKTIFGYEEILVIGGDFNVAPTDLDVYDPNELRDAICFNRQEKIAYRKLLNIGMTDAYRAMYPNQPGFTWWDYRAGSWQHNKGMRIDHLLLSPEAADSLQEVTVDTEVRGLEKSSDHAPVICELKIG